MSASVRLRLLLLPALASVALSAATTPLAGQEVAPVLTGAAAGSLAGAFVSVGIVTLEARRGNYLFSLRDALNWRAAPILVGAGAGVVLGTGGWDRLGGVALGGLIGGLGGAAAGAAFGQLRWPAPEGRWAGGVIGGAAGLVLGISIAAALGASSAGESDGLSASIRIPLP